MRTLRRSFLWGTTAFVLAAPLTRVLAQAPPSTPPTLEAMTARIDGLYRSSGTIARIELSIVTPRQSRTLRMQSWSRGEDRALIVIEAPAREAGTATLRRDRNLWNYLPRISRTMRVPPSMMLSGWMGSDVTNDDLTQSSTFARDFAGSVVGRSESPAGWLVRYEAREGTVGLWRRIEYVVGDDLLPRVARYHDRAMRLARIMQFEDVRELDGRRIPTRFVILPQDREGHRTEMRYLSVDFDADVPESTFSLTELERGR
ncbi:MAG: outer membrane lipoprotein-sorting protein [Deltaproteobacteria bacterium]|nr:outer membrane lipoprotein-sorting protein [Deltaproteobacteria bacterium]